MNRRTKDREAVIFEELVSVGDELLSVDGTVFDPFPEDDDVGDAGVLEEESVGEASLQRLMDGV